MNQETLYYSIKTCALGLLLAAISDAGLCAILLDDDPQFLKAELKKRFPKALLVENNIRTKDTLENVVNLMNYPEKDTQLVLDERGTQFQKQVWKALRNIPLGTTVAYSDIARNIGRPEAVRAVGAACGANPLAIVTPCHRVLSKDGKLTGFRWGTQRKLQLLQMESNRKMEPKA